MKVFSVVPAPPLVVVAPAVLVLVEVPLLVVPPVVPEVALADAAVPLPMLAPRRAPRVEPS